MRAAARALPYAAVAAAAASWGTWPIWLKHAPMHAALQSAIVMAVITIAAGAASLRDRIAVRAPQKARACVLWLGVGDALNVLLFFAAYKLTTAVAVLTHYLTPIFVAIAAPIALREKLTPRTFAAVVVAFAGLAVMLTPSGSGAAVLTSAALGAGSAVFYASNVVVNKFVVESFSTSETTFWHGVVATPLLAAFVPRDAWLALDAHAAAVLALVSIGPGALAGLSFVWGLRRMPAAHASTLTLIEPLVAVVLGAALLGEPMGARAVAGGALILAGAAIVVRPPRRGADAS